MKKIILKKGREKPVLQKHHWIFSGAVGSVPEKIEAGEFLPVYSSDSQLLGTAYINPKATIIGRMISFDETPPLLAIENAFDRAIALRQELFNPSITNAYRLINAEGDGIPGLVVDRYADIIVFQISTIGMENLRPFIIDLINKKLKPRTIFEKSSLPSRKEEGLPPVIGVKSGDLITETVILENDIKFHVEFEHSQKTGFFLDQREMRQLIREKSSGKRVLNAFAYTGGFSLGALLGGATSVDSVDISEKAVDMIKRNLTLNGFSPENNRCIKDDVFTFLRENSLDYDIVILDPPAFAKRQKDVVQACRGYKDINRVAFEKMPPRSYLLTCSCSYHVDEKLFQQVVFQAAAEAKRNVRIIERHRMASDHPINLFHPESDYLKSLFLYID